MNEEAILDSYNLFVQNGYTKSLDEYKQLLLSNPNALNDSYGLFQQNGYKKSLDEFKTLMGVSQQKPITPTKINLPATDIKPKEIETYQAPKEEPTEEDYFTGSFGNVLRGFDKVVPIGLGDFIDDMARSVASGYRQGSVAEEADRLLLQGTKATPEQIQKFIDANKNAQSLGPSAEMNDYQKIYEDEGKGFWGVVKGLANNPSIIPEVLTSSITAMATNTDALTAGAAAIGTGAGIGAAAGAPAGGVGAIPGAVAGSIASVPYAFGLASSVVEMGSTFGELLQEELGEKEMTKDNVKAILENPDKLNDIRNKAIARGAIIGTVDAFTGKLASGVGAKILSRSAAKSATGAATKGSVTKATAAGAAIEGVGGSAGEATARGAIGQEMDVSEIALEGLAELPGGIRSTIQARLAKPSYKVNGEKVSAEQVDELINTMSPADLAKTKIDIKNDYEGREFKIQDKIVTNSIKEQVRQGNPELNEPSLNAITQLEKDLRALEGNTTQTGKDKAAAIRGQIKNIQENQLQEEAVSEAVVAEAPEIAQQRVDRIAEIETALSPESTVVIEDAEKIKLQTELETLKSEQDAIQKQTAGQVPVLTEAGVGEKVVQGEPQAEPQVTAEAGVQEEVTTAPAQEQEVSLKTSMVEMTDEEIVEYNPIEEIADKNNEVLGKTLQSKKIAPQAEPMVTDLGDTVVFEYNNFDENETRTRLTFNKSDDGSITQKGVKIEQNVGDIRGTDLFRNYVDAKRAEAAQEQVTAQVQVAEQVVAEEQFVPLANSDIEFDIRFSRDEASDVVEDEREGENGRSYTYISEVETPVSDVDGEQIGYLVKMVDEDKNLSFEARDADGNNLSKNEEGFGTLGEAKQALLNNHNKSKKKEFDREVKAKAKEKVKADAKAAKAKEKAEAKKPAAPVKVEPSTQSEEEQVARMMELFQKGAAATTDSGISVTNKSQIDSIKGKVTDKLKLKVIESAQKALKTLRSVLPNFDIIIHDNEGSYNAAMIARGGVAGSSGNFSINKKGSYSGRIDINLERANARTVAHEVAHGIMLKAFGDTPALFKKFRDRISTVLKESTNEKLIDFAAQYEGDVTYEEYLAELTAILEQQEENISPSVLQKIAAIINSVISKITNGTFKPFEDVKNTKETIEFFSGIAKSIRQGEEIITIDSKAMEEGVSLALGNPVTISKSQVGERVSFSKNAPPLSFVTEADKIDINSLINEIVDKKQKVWFWMADQLGRGNYYDEVIGGEHYLDAGPSFALDPENRSKGILWASGLPEKTLTKQINEADYIFFISGSPEKAKLFNKRVINLLENRINKTSNFNTFKDALNKFGKETVELNTMRDAVKGINSFKELADSPKRKPFLLALGEISALKTTPAGSLKELLGSFNAFIDYNQLRDGFYRDNEFTQNDIMLVGKPTELGGKAPHSTYEFAIRGEVVGVPDKKVDSWNIMPESLKEKYKQGNKFIDEKTGKEKVRGDLSIAQKAKIVAAETGVIRELESQAANRVKDLGGLLGFDLGKPVSKSQISNTPLPVNTEVANGYNVLKKKFGETAARAIRENIPFALDYPTEFAEFISKKIPVKEDVAFVVKNLSQRLDGLFRLESDKNIETVKVKNKTPEELSKEAGYVFHRPESENDILAFKKDFENGEVLCTYNDVEGRMQGHFIFWLRRNDAESVLPAKKITQEYLKGDSEGSSLWRGYLDAKGLKMPDGSYDISNLNASRQDPYGTSSMSVQIGRRGGNISIKNRYNHTVNNPDATFGNDLNTIIDGLNDAVFGIEGIPKQTNQELRLPDNITSDSQGRFFKYDQEIDNIYVSQHGYVDDGEMTIIDKSYQRMIDNFVFDSKNNTVKPISIGSQLIRDINKINFEKNKITVDSKDGKFEFELLDGFLNKLESNTKTINNDFLSDNKTLISVSLPNVEFIGTNFLYSNKKLDNISLPNVKNIMSNFLYYNTDLKSISLPKATNINANFLRNNNTLESISLPNVEKIGDSFLFNNEDLDSISLPNAEFIGEEFLFHNLELKNISLPNVKTIRNSFIYYNDILDSISLPNVIEIGGAFLMNNKDLKSISLPNVEIIGDFFVRGNDLLNTIDLPKVGFIGNNFLRDNYKLKSISLPSVKIIGDRFLQNNVTLENISLPNVEEIGKQFLYYNTDLKNISLPKIKKIDDYFMVNNEFGIERPPNSKSQISSNNEINAAVRNFREQGFSESAIKAFLIQQGYSATEANQIMNIGPIQEEFNSLMNEVDKLIARQKSRGIEDSKITSNIDTFIRKQDEYLNANDAQKKIIEREARGKMGAAPKRAVSIGRVLGALKDITNISRQEKLKIISQIRQLSKDAAKDLAKEIRSMASSGKITAVQAANIIARFGKVNMLNEVSVSNFVDYMAKVFANAEYANKIDVAKSKLKNARQNIATKIGIADGLVGSLQRLFSVNPNIIPDQYLERYLELLNMFSERKAVLTLQEKSKVIKDVESILNEIAIEQSKADELADRFNNSENKVFDDNGNLDFAASIKEMVNQNEITQEEADIMRKYKSDIMPQVESQKMTEEEILEKKKEYITELKDVGINPTGLSTQNERNLAKRLSNLIGSTRIEELMNLSLTELKNLLKVADNINNNYLPSYAYLMVKKLTAINDAKTLTSAIKKAVIAPLSGLYSRVKTFVSRSKRTAISEMIRRNPLFNVDQLFGDFKTKDIFNAVLNKVSEGESRFKTDLKRVQNILEKAEQKVAKSFNLNPDKTLMSKFKMMTYMIQLEYDSNQGSKQVNPAAEYLKATIKHIDEGKSQFGERDANMLQEILNEYAPDGKIDNEKLYKSFNEAEKSAIKDIRGVNESLRDKAEYTAAIIRGDRINPLTNYVHLNVLHEHQPNDLTSGIAFVNDYNNSMRPSTKAKSLIERTGKVSPLNFDIFASAQRGAKFVLMDFNLTEPIQTARQTIKETIANFEKEGRIPKEKREIINAIDSAFEEATENLLTNNFVSNSFGDDVADYIQKQGYRAVLAGTGRFVSELTSNIGFALIVDPKAFNTGIENRGFIMSVDAPLVMENVGSKQTNRVFPTDTLSGKLIDTNILQQASGIRGAKSKNPVANKIQQIWNLSGKKYVNTVELAADALISTPDKLMMRPMWFGSFANEFQNITGKKVNFEKIAANDESYMGQYKEAIEKAKTIADEKSVMAGSTDNAFMGILKGTTKPDQSVTTRAFNNFNNFMTRFLIFEYVTARTGINAAMGNGSLTKKQGVALLGGVTTRMVVYTLLTQMLGSGLMGLFFDDDEEETEKSFMQKLGQSLASAFTSLIIGRDFGNATKMFINEGVERANEKYLDFLREGEYDPYKDAIQYSIIPPDKKGRQTDLMDFFLNMGGAFGPALKTADFITRKALEPEKKKEEAIERREKEINVRIPLEILGNAGLIPLYKDIRKAVMKDIYKDLEKAEKTLGDKKKIKAEKLQGYETESDMKRYDPQLWERTFGEDAVDYDEVQAEKALKKAKDSLERAMKDEMYNYTPKSKGGFGSAGFGEKSKSKGGFGSAKFGGN